jgi:FtsZ-binding cell division protein ZapB
MGVVKFREGFEWFYKHQQSEDDVLLFKNYDNTTSVHVKARTCLHTAFEIPRKDVPAGAPTRESIEVRALIFTYPENEARPPSARTLPISHAGGSLQRAVESISHERTDIDEGNEIKDAVLMLRRQEIQRLKEEKESLREERESLAVELKLSQTQVGKLLAKTQDLSRRLVAAGGTLGSSNFAAAGSLNVCVLGTDNHTGPA